MLCTWWILVGAPERRDAMSTVTVMLIVRALGLKKINLSLAPKHCRIVLFALATVLKRNHIERNNAV